MQGRRRRTSQQRPTGNGFQPLRQSVLQPQTRYLGRVVSVYPNSANVDIGYGVLGKLPRSRVLPGTYKIETDPWAETEEEAVYKRLVHERIPEEKDVRDYLETGDVVAVMVTRCSQHQVSLARAPRLVKQQQKQPPKAPSRAVTAITSTITPSSSAAQSDRKSLPVHATTEAKTGNQPSSFFSHSMTTRPSSVASSPARSEASHSRRAHHSTLDDTQSVGSIASDMKTVVSKREKRKTLKKKKKKNSMDHGTRTAAPLPKRKELAELRRGKVYSGVIRSVHDFGAFVDLGAVKDGLLPLGELRYWNNGLAKRGGGAFPTTFDIVRVGEKMLVEIERVNKKKARISLSIVQKIPGGAAKHMVKPRGFYNKNEFPALAA